jgi:DnaK suppressor protein
VPTKPEPKKSGSFNPRQVLLDLLSSIKVGRSIEAIEKGDEIDLATDEISRELDAKISMRQAKQVKEIEDALERIKHGDYGICEDCGETIPEQRLRLFPAARLCVRCQEDADRFEKMKEDSSLRGGAWRDDSSDGGFSKSFDD